MIWARAAVYRSPVLAMRSRTSALNSRCLVMTVPFVYADAPCPPALHSPGRDISSRDAHVTVRARPEESSSFALIMARGGGPAGVGVGSIARLTILISSARHTITLLLSP